MGKTMKFVSGLVAVSTLLVSCGGGDSSSGRTRNGVLEGATSKCITASSYAENPAELEIRFCSQVASATVWSGDQSPGTVIVPEDRTWATTGLDLTNVTSVRVQSLGADGKVLFDETIDLTFDDLSRKSCADGGLCNVTDEGPRGGRVFYVADSPQSWGTYLAMLPQLGDKQLFGCDNVEITDTKNGIGNSSENTKKIIAACGTSSPIMETLKPQISAGGASLPTRDEVVLAAKNLQGIEGFDLRATAENGYSRPAVSDMPVAGVDGVSENEVNRRARTVDFFAYPNWSHMEVMRTMSELAIWPVYAFSTSKPAILEASVRPTSTDSSSTETPTTIGEIASPVCSVAQEDIIDNAGGDYTTGDLPKTFECADVHGANFTDRDLRRFSFVFANVSRANFTNANLEGANFTDANCRNANFTGANLTGALFSGDLCPDPRLTESTSQNFDFYSILNLCREVKDVVKIVSEVNTTDEPVQVEFKPGCDLPAYVSERVQVSYDVTVSGAKYFSGWGAEHVVVQRASGVISQKLPADNYRLAYTQILKIDGHSFAAENSGTLEFEVTEGAENIEPRCALADLRIVDKTLSFPCAEASDLVVTYEKSSDGFGGSLTVSGKGQVDLSGLPDGWHRIMLQTSGALLNNSWGLVVCHTSCGPTPGSAQYKVTKTGSDVKIFLPLCEAGGEASERGFIRYITPLFKVGNGLLHIPTTQLGPEADIESVESPQAGFWLIRHDVTVIMTKSEAVAGVQVFMASECDEESKGLSISVFDAIEQDTTANTTPASHDVLPVVLKLDSISTPIMLPEDVNSVSLILANTDENVKTTELSFDGTQWFPIAKSQPTLLNVETPTKVYVRSTDKDGVEKVITQDVLPAGSTLIDSDGDTSTVPSSSQATNGSSSKVMVLVIVLGLLLIVLAAGMVFKKSRK